MQDPLARTAIVPLARTAIVLREALHTQLCMQCISSSGTLRRRLYWQPPNTNKHAQVSSSTVWLPAPYGLPIGWPYSTVHSATLSLSMLMIKCSALQGLKMFPALVIVPALQICWTLFSILSGMLYFHEYEGMRAGPTAMFVIGVAVSQA